MRHGRQCKSTFLQHFVVARILSKNVFILFQSIHIQHMLLFNLCDRYRCSRCSSTAASDWPCHANFEQSTARFTPSLRERCRPRNEELDRLKSRDACAGTRTRLTSCEQKTVVWIRAADAIDREATSMRERMARVREELASEQRSRTLMVRVWREGAACSMQLQSACIRSGTIGEIRESDLVCNVQKRVKRANVSRQFHTRNRDDGATYY
jgi:hypothetical protein